MELGWVDNLSHNFNDLAEKPLIDLAEKPLGGLAEKHSPLLKKITTEEVGHVSP